MGWLPGPSLDTANADEHRAEGHLSSQWPSSYVHYSQIMGICVSFLLSHSPDNGSLGSFPHSLFPDNGVPIHSHFAFSWMMGRQSSPNPAVVPGGPCSSPAPRVFLEADRNAPHLWILTSGWQSQVTAGAEKPPHHQPPSPPCAGTALNTSTLEVLHTCFLDFFASLHTGRVLGRSSPFGRAFPIKHKEHPAAPREYFHLVHSGT